jgi:hypothetical protein
MLAELAAANAAFAIIKQTLANGKELVDAGKAISQYVDAKETLQSKANKKKNSFWNQVGGKSGDDLEEFMALEQIKQQENELREAMQLYGRAGLWQDWVRFQAEARSRRVAARKQAEKERQQFIDNCIMAFYWAVCIGLGLATLGIILWVVKESMNV